MNRFVVFGQDKSWFALQLTGVREVLVFSEQRITPVPNTQPFLLGLTNLRGEILAVADFGSFIGTESIDWPQEESRILVCEIPDSQDVKLPPMRMGLAVSRVEGVLNLNHDKIVSAAEVSEELAPFLR